MGKGTIGAHIGAGKYTVTLSLDRARSEARIQELTDAINRVDLIELAALEAALEAARADLEQSIQELDAVIGTQDREAMSAAARLVAEKSAARDKARIERDTLKLRLAALKKEKGYLQANTPADPVVEAWCADLSEDLSGAVATMEIPGERKGVPVLIRPGDTSAHPNGAAYDPTRDGQLQPSIASKSAGVFYNWALLPGWQKARPAYRIGTIVSIEGDVCALTLDPAQSSAQSLNVNQVESLINVPIVYMDCNGAAFKVDDRVVVEFQTRDWDQPRVIGFESNPRGCGFAGLWCWPTSDDAPQGWGKPFENDQGTINPPLGTVGGTDPAVGLEWEVNEEGQGSWRVKRSITQVAGERFWFPPAAFTPPYNAPLSWMKYQGQIYQRGRVLATFFSAILAAAIIERQPETGPKEYRLRVLGTSDFYFKQVDVYESEPLGGGALGWSDWTKLHTADLTPPVGFTTYSDLISEWEINESCTLAACIARTTPGLYSWDSIPLWPQHHRLQVDLETGVAQRITDAKWQAEVREASTTNATTPMGGGTIAYPDPCGTGAYSGWEYQYTISQTTTTRKGGNVRYWGTLTVGVGFRGDEMVLATVEWERETMRTDIVTQFCPAASLWLWIMDAGNRILGSVSSIKNMDGAYLQYGCNDGRSGCLKMFSIPYESEKQWDKTYAATAKAELKINGVHMATVSDWSYDGPITWLTETNWITSNPCTELPKAVQSPPVVSPNKGTFKTASIIGMDLAERVALVQHNTFHVQNTPDPGGPYPYYTAAYWQDIRGALIDAGATIKATPTVDYPESDQFIWPTPAGPPSTVAKLESTLIPQLIVHPERAWMPRTIFASAVFTPPYLLNERVYLNYLTGAEDNDPVVLMAPEGANPRFYPVKAL